MVSIQPKPKNGLEEVPWVCAECHICFNPAEAEEWFRSINSDLIWGWYRPVSIQPKPKNGLEEGMEFKLLGQRKCFNPAEAEEWFRRKTNLSLLKGNKCFNPAEAEEWFRRLSVNSLWKITVTVSIQPKPKNGLEGVVPTAITKPFPVSIQPKPKNGLEVEEIEERSESSEYCFNPAEAEEWFRRKK